MTSGLRLDEILADYFTSKEEKAKQKSQSKEYDSESHHHKSSHRKQKHKKKYKKHKKSRDTEDDECSGRKRRSRSSEHKGRHKEKKHSSKAKRIGLTQDPANGANSECQEKTCSIEKQESTSNANPVSENGASAGDGNAIASNLASKEEKTDSETVPTTELDGLGASNTEDLIEEGEIVNETADSSQDATPKTSSHKRKNKKRKKREDRSLSSSPGRKHLKSSSSHKHHRRRSRSESRERRDSRSTHEGHHSGWNHRSRSRSREKKSATDSVRDLRERIDKKRLLEIARKNVLEMIENGTLPQGLPVANLQPQQLVSIKAGGKSVEELTEFCKALAEKHKDYRSSSSDDEHRGPQSSDEEDAPFLHHPFKVKEVQPVIRMNIRNAVQLPLRTTAEKTADAVKLRQQFPVSSGNQHRTKELEWVPVEKPDSKPAPSAKKGWGTAANSKPTAVAVEALPPPPPPAPPPPPPPPAPATVAAETVTVLEPQAVPQTVVQAADVVFPAIPTEEVDIGTVMAERLHAIRKLQENPHDVQALGQMYNAQQQMQNWAQSKIQPGQFGHSVTNRLLTPEELTGPYPVWARKDQLTSATPVQGGIGMHLLKKMGWNPGEGLGKNKEGSLVPLMLDVKTDKKGLYSNTEASKPLRTVPARVAHDLSGKHPVSALMELCSKRKWGAPDYQILDETGPDHRKNFLFKVRVKGVDYQPSLSSASKKQAKALAATVCLQALGLVPRDLNNPL